MALVTRDANASLDASTGMFAPQISGGLIAGEDLDIAAPCYIKASDGKVYMSNGTTAGEASKVAGFTPRAAKSGQPVALFGIGARLRYGSGLAKGSVLYVGATAGRLDTVASVGDRVGVAMVVSDTDIVVIRSGHQAGTVTQGNAGVFISTEQTGTGAAQNIAHGLGVAPSKVFVAPTDTAPATTGQYTVTEGAHDATNVVVTVTNGKKYKVMAWV